MPVTFGFFATDNAKLSGYTITRPRSGLMYSVYGVHNKPFAMTARLLKMANSVFYNPGGIRISTVSRAIVILGFNTVRNIALSISLVETMLSGSRHDNALAELVCYQAPAGELCLISVYGSDKPGIVYRITRELADRVRQLMEAEITKMQGRVDAMWASATTAARRGCGWPPPGPGAASA